MPGSVVGVNGCDLCVSVSEWVTAQRVFITLSMVPFISGTHSEFTECCALVEEIGELVLRRKSSTQYWH